MCIFMCALCCVYALVSLVRHFIEQGSKHEQVTTYDYIDLAFELGDWLEVGAYVVEQGLLIALELVCNLIGLVLEGLGVILEGLVLFFEVLICF